jgi:hypothetical protein
MNVSDIAVTLVDSLLATDLGTDCSLRMTKPWRLRVQPGRVTRAASDDADGCTDAATPTSRQAYFGLIPLDLA